MNMKRFIFLWSPVIIFAGLVFIVSSMSMPGKEAPFPLFDKAAHVSEYALFSILLFRALNGSLRGSSFLFLSIITIVITLAYGISDEFHQSFVPSRSSDIKDLAADGIGALLAMTSVFIKRRIFSSEHVHEQLR